MRSEEGEGVEGGETLYDLQCLQRVQWSGEVRDHQLVQ